MNLIAERFFDHRQVLLDTEKLIPIIEEMGQLIKTAIHNGHKVLFCGNGGSAADAQHLAAEFIGRFQKERPSLPAIALTTDSSILTAVANDYGYNAVFERQVAGLGRPGDVLVGISTSGNSQNVVAAITLAKEKGMATIGMTGRGGGKMAEICDVALAVPSEVTARTQEMHILVGHILCEMVEETL